MSESEDHQMEVEVDKRDVDGCPLCVESGLQCYQCCPKVSDSLCESCWSKTIAMEIDRGRIASLFNGRFNCLFCHQPIKKENLPEKIQTRLRHILSTIPTTKHPTKVEDFNYTFNDQGELRHCLTGEKFIFLTQRHYSLLGSCVETYILSKMKAEPWNYREIWLPLRDEPNEDHSDQVNIFVSDDFQSNQNGCLILIQGSGVVRPGQWARSCCINESLDIGGKPSIDRDNVFDVIVFVAMFPYMNKAKENNLSVIILNPNQTSYIDPSSSSSSISDKPDESDENDVVSFYLSSDPLPRPCTTKIAGLATNREHILYVYDNVIANSCPAQRFYVVAHSAGGDGLMYLLRKRSDEVLPKLTKIAFTDSVHSVLPVESNEIRSFLRSKAIHFVASDKRMGTPIDTGYDFSQRSACEEVSAGHPKHEYTSGCCVEGVFDFFFRTETNEQEQENVQSTMF